jgi:hypothetical protein
MSASRLNSLAYTWKWYISELQCRRMAIPYTTVTFSISASGCLHPWGQWKLDYPHSLTWLKFGDWNYERKKTLNGIKRGIHTEIVTFLYWRPMNGISGPFHVHSTVLMGLLRMNHSLFKRKFRIPFKIVEDYAFFHYLSLSCSASVH